MNISDLLVVSDLDGTLLTETKTISKQSLAALDALRAGGGRFTVATGRSVESARKYVEWADVDLPVIVYNGVMLYDYKAEQVLWNDLLPERAKAYVRQLMDAFPTVGVEVLKSDQIYIVRTNAHVKEHVEIEMLKHTHCALEAVDGEWFKVLMAMDTDLVPEVARFTKEHEFEDVYFVHSAAHYFEMLPKGSSKGNALRMLCKLTGQPIEHTAAVGDFNNDSEMIKNSAFGGAMGNAPNSVKAVADVVVAENENEGFAEFVRLASAHDYK